MNSKELCGTYSLTHFNGKQAPTSVVMVISRECDDIKVLIKVANTLRGKLRYEDQHISATLMSTMMMGDENQMVLEDALSGGFGIGLQVRKENDRLLLKNAYHAFIFVKIMSLEDIFGEHAIISIDGDPPSEDLTIKFINDHNGGTFLIANIGSSIRGNCTVEGGVLQGEVASTDVALVGHLAVIEAKVTRGLESGYRISKNQTGLLLESSTCTLQLYHVVTREELAGEYLLKRFNGKSVEATVQSTITFQPSDGESQVSIFIVVANRIRGTAALEQNILKSEEPLMSTRMLGSEDEATLETAYNAGFQYGLEVSLNVNQLLLKDEENEFLFTRVAVIDSVNGQPTYKGTYGIQCFKSHRNGLLFRIVNEHERKWAFYNDTKDYRMHVHATFGSRSNIVALHNAVMEKDSEGKFVVEVTVDPLATAMFISGKVNGFKILYNAEPV